MGFKQKIMSALFLFREIITEHYFFTNTYIIICSAFDRYF
jgi:hypothetical protein